MKWMAVVLVYLSISIGFFWAHSAWVTLVGLHAAMIVSLIIARPNLSFSILFKNTNPKWNIANILLCALSGICLYFLRFYAGIVPDLHAQLESIGLTTQTWLPFIFYAVLVNPFIEEYFWRGYLGSNAKGFHVFDLVFASYHILILIGKASPLAVVLIVIVLTCAAWFWRQAARESGGLLAPALGHMAADLTILLAVYRIYIS
jgi:membrane protease YdiL (CAAX protease family)